MRSFAVVCIAHSRAYTHGAGQASRVWCAVRPGGRSLCSPVYLIDKIAHIFG